MFNAVEHYSGSEAAKWQAGLDTRTLNPILEAYGSTVIIEGEVHSSTFLLYVEQS